jgi:hypothetical protein
VVFPSGVLVSRASAGISTRPGHLEARSKCINDFVEIFGGMTLVNETSHIVRGLHVIN